MRKITFCFLFASLFLSHYVSHAQDSSHVKGFCIGVRGGISIPNLSAGSNNQNPLNTGYSSRQGPDAAIYADFRISKLFSIEPMIQYSSQGGQKNGMQAFPTPAAYAAAFPPGAPVPTYLYANFKSEAKINYIMIPILAKFGWNIHRSPWRIYVDAGPFIGILAAAHQVTTGSSEVYLDQAGTMPASQGPQSFNNTQDIKSQLQSTNFGIEGNVGVSYRFGRSNIFVEGGGNYGFVNIQKGSANGKNNTGAATADIGYGFRFGR